MLGMHSKVHRGQRSQIDEFFSTPCRKKESSLGYRKLMVTDIHVFAVESLVLEMEGIVRKKCSVATSIF